MSDQGPSPLVPPTLASEQQQQQQEQEPEQQQDQEQNQQQQPQQLAEPSVDLSTHMQTLLETLLDSPAGQQALRQVRRVRLLLGSLQQAVDANGFKYFERDWSETRQYVRSLGELSAGSAGGDAMNM